METSTWTTREASWNPDDPPNQRAAILTPRQGLWPLARGPKPVTTVEEAAEKAHIEPHALEQARADLHVVVSRGNADGVKAVQWSLPG